MAVEEYTVRSVDELHGVGTSLLADLSYPATWLLSGQLGSGKTTFVQGIAADLNIREDVTSPTFMITAEYPVRDHQTIDRLIHVDLYRLAEDGPQRDPAVQDVVQRAHDPGRLTVVEWGEKLGTATPKNSWMLTFAIGAADNERILRVER